MADQQRKIVSHVSLEGDTSLQPDQEYVVGTDIGEELAVALCTQPPDDPRAHAIGWDPWAGSGKEETEEPPDGEEPSEEGAEEEGAMETSTPPAAEQRETATQPRGRRRVKPPKQDKEEPKEPPPAEPGDTGWEEPGAA